MVCHLRHPNEERLGASNRASDGEGDVVPSLAQNLSMSSFTRVRILPAVQLHYQRYLYPRPHLSKPERRNLSTCYSALHRLALQRQMRPGAWSQTLRRDFGRPRKIGTSAAPLIHLNARSGYAEKLNGQTELIRKVNNYQAHAQLRTQRMMGELRKKLPEVPTHITDLLLAAGSM